MYCINNLKIKCSQLHVYYVLLLISSAGMEAEEEAMDVQGAAAAEPSLAGQGHSNVIPVWALLEQATQMKTEGNAFYKDKNIRSAIGRYHRALLVLRGLDSEVLSSVKGFGPERPPLTSEQEAALRNTQVDCYNNLAGRKDFQLCHM